MLPASPANVATLMPAHSASAASSVKSSRPAAAALAMRVEQRREGEGLRRLHGCAGRARSTVPATRPVGIDALDRVGDRRAPGSPRRSRRRRRSRATRVPTSERPRRVVDQHDVGRASRSAPPGRPAPKPAASRRRTPAASARGPWRPPRRTSRVVGMDDRLHGTDLAMPGEQRKARPDHRLARQRSVLLGQIAPGAGPAPGCNDHGGDRGRHSPNSLKSDADMALARCPGERKRISTSR